MGVIILVIIVGVIVICLFDTDESCSSFKDEKELIECLNLTEEEIQWAKQLDESFVNEDNLEDIYVMTRKIHPYGYQDFLIDRAKRIGKREGKLFGDGSMLLGISAFIVVLVAYLFDIHSEVYRDHETDSYFLYCLGNNISIVDRDVYLCKLYSFICFYVSFFLSYFGFGVYFVSYIGGNKVLTEKLGFNIGMTMMVFGFATHLVFLRYILFKSYDLILFQRIGYYFGLFNLWCALIALVLISVSFVCHRYEAKRRYMNNVCEKIEEFYEKEKIQSK